MTGSDFAIIGAGLAGCECALALARAGFTVSLFEQKPHFYSAAHQSAHLAELVCSNSFRSDDPESAIGLLHQEMRQLGSQVMAVADSCRVPADRALAVDREAFSDAMSRIIEANHNIKLIRQRVDNPEEIPSDQKQQGVIIAAGPLASAGLAEFLADITGRDRCYFYDAIAPIVWTDSLDHNVIFRASRHSEGEGDYLNCPMNPEEYERFYNALLTGETFKSQHGEAEKHFEGCMPIEALASRGPRTLSFGPLKPVGFIDPRTGRRPYAVLQLRAEQVSMDTCNLVGCQTKLLQAEQKRIFRLVPGLENAEFCRFGSMHRNTYINAPEVLNIDLALKKRSDIFMAGQITGVEGYVESAACGLWLGLSLAAKAAGKNLESPPPETALGALLNHLRKPAKDFQPSNINFGLMPSLSEKIRKKERKQHYVARALEKFADWRKANSFHII